MKNRKIIVVLLITLVTVVLVALLVLILVLTNRPTIEVTNKPTSYSNIQETTTVSYPVSYSANSNHFVRSDNKYEFSFSTNFTLIRDYMGTQILKSSDTVSDSNFNPNLVIYSNPSNGQSLADWAYGHSTDYVDFKNFSVNGLPAASYKYIRDEYEDDMYTILKDDTVVVIQFRIWTKFNGEYQNLSNLSSEVESIVNSVVVH